MSIDRSAPAAIMDSIANRLFERFRTVQAAIDGRHLELRALAIFAMRVASAALLFLVQILLARWLGAAEYGVYAALWTAVLVAGGLSHLGLSLAAIRLVPQYAAERSFDLLQGLLLGSRAVPFAIASACALLAVTVLSIFPSLAPNDHWWPAVLAFACLPAFAVTEVQDGIGRGQGWTAAGLAPPYILRPALLFLATAIGVAIAAPATATTAMIGAAAATWGTLIVQSVMIQRRIATCVERASPRYEFRTWIGVALPLLAVGGCELIMQNADVLVLSWLRPSSEVGIYYAAAKTQAIALFVHYAVGSAIAGRISAANAQADRRELDKLVAQAARWTFWPTLAVTVSLLVLGIPLLSLFGGAFVDAYPVMLIAAIGILARAAAGPADYILNMLGHHKACARAFMIAAAVSIVGNLLLVPWFGTTGAAIATTLAFATAAILNALTLRRITGIDPLGTLLPASLTWPSASAAATPAVSADPALVCATITTRADFVALSGEWQELVTRASGPVQPFLAESWHRHWLDTFLSSGDDPAVITVRRDGRLVLIWPLLLHRSPGGVLATWMGAPVSQYGDLLVEQAADTEQLIETAFAHARDSLGADVLWLRKVRADAAIGPAVQRFGGYATETLAAPCVTLADEQGPRRYEALYSAKCLKNRRRLLRRLEETGRVEFEHYHGGEEAAMLVDAAFTMKRAWLSEKGLISNAIEDDKTQAFFRAVARAEPTTWVAVLKLDGRPIAINIMLEAANRVFAHIITYDLAHAKSGAGVLLMENCIRRSIELGRLSFDLLAPADPYKSDWTEDAVGVNDWCVALTWRGWLYEHIYLGGARRLAKRLIDRMPSGMRRWLVVEPSRLLHRRG